MIKTEDTEERRQGEIVTEVVDNGPGNVTKRTGSRGGLTRETLRQIQERNLGSKDLL